MSEKLGRLDFDTRINGMSTKIFYKDENSVILLGDMLSDKKIPENHMVTSFMNTVK